jgi:hypothetical protein
VLCRDRKTVRKYALDTLCVTMHVILSMIIVAGCVGGCVTAQTVAPATVSKYEGFIQDGKSTKQEIEDRLGPAQSSYENGRILIYYTHLEDDGRMNLKGSGTCYACVMVFDKESLLERHSLVKHGCR